MSVKTISCNFQISLICIYIPISLNFEKNKTLPKKKQSNSKIKKKKFYLNVKYDFIYLLFL